MGIHDRDYMKRRREDDERGSPGSVSGSNAEDSLRRFLQKYPRFFLYLVIVTAILLILAAIATKPASGN